MPYTLCSNGHEYNPSTLSVMVPQRFAGTASDLARHSLNQRHQSNGQAREPALAQIFTVGRATFVVMVEAAVGMIITS